MLILLVVFLVVNGKRGCDSERSERLVERGLSQAKQAQILELHNTHRNDVALGKKKNWNKREEKAAMMYYLKYDQKLAQLAQECADGCPKNIMQDCQIPLMNGFVFYEGDVINGGADWNAAMVFRSMIFERDQARQIEEGGLTAFGCGHSQVDRKSVRTEVVVCYYNKKVQRNGDVYKLGLPGNSCPHGLKKGFLGLCRHSPMDLSVFHKHHHHKQHQ